MTQQPFDLSNIPRDSRRVPLATKVAFKFDRFSGFISEFSSNISPTGLYITTKSPEPPGSMLEFEFHLGDGFEIIRGKGEVVWTRAIAEGPGRPPGMGIRFLELSEGSKELIYRIVDQYIQEGGTPFDVSVHPPDPVPAAELALPANWPAPPPSPAVTVRTPMPEPPEPLDPGVDFSSWLPPADVLETPPDDDLPPFMPPLDDDFASPSPASPAVPRPNLTFSGLAAARPRRKPHPALWIALAAVLLLAGAGYFFRDSLMEMAGLGAEEPVNVAQTQPPVRRRVPPPPPPVETPADQGKPIDGSDASETAPLPETAAAQTPAAPALSPLTALEKITFEPAFGGTDLILWGDGAIPAESYSASSMGNPPRELIRLLGITRPFPTTRVAVGTSEVKQVRIGYHEKAGGNELHIVIDLGAPGVKITGMESRDRQLRIHLQGR